jgi:hypothetical protein
LLGIYSVWIFNMKMLTSLGKIHDFWRGDLFVFNALYSMLPSAITSTSRGWEIIGARSNDWSSPPFAHDLDGDPVRGLIPQSSPWRQTEGNNSQERGTWLREVPNQTLIDTSVRAMVVSTGIIFYQNSVHNRTELFACFRISFCHFCVEDINRSIRIV